MLGFYIESTNTHTEILETHKAKVYDVRHQAAERGLVTEVAYQYSIADNNLYRTPVSGNDYQHTVDSTDNRFYYVTRDIEFPLERL